MVAAVELIFAAARRRDRAGRERIWFGRGCMRPEPGSPAGESARRRVSPRTAAGLPDHRGEQQPVRNRRGEPLQAAICSPAPESPGGRRVGSAVERVLDTRAIASIVCA